MNINNKLPGAERQTRQREAVARVFARAGRPLTPAEVLGAARKTVRGLGLATVYRTVKLMAGEGALKVVKLPGEPVRYEPTGSRASSPLPVRGRAGRSIRSAVVPAR